MLLRIIYISICTISVSASTSTSSSSSSPYSTIAHYLHQTIPPSASSQTGHPPRTESSLIQNLQTLSKSQSTFKTIDGTSHELYQRQKIPKSNSYSSNVENTLGRAERTAGRVGACADALLGCEFLDYAFDTNGYYDINIMNNNTNNNKVMSSMTEGEKNDWMECYQNRNIVFKKTIICHTSSSSSSKRRKQSNIENIEKEGLPLDIVVIYESDYNGGAGIHHGGIDGLTTTTTNNPTTKQKRGRYIVIIKDGYETNLESSLRILDEDPTYVELTLGLVSGEIASVNKRLYHAANDVIMELERNHVLTSHLGDESSSVEDEISMKKMNDDDDDGEDENDDGEDDKGDNEKKKKIITTPTETRNKIIKEEDIESLPAIHFIGRSLGGGVASLCSLMLDGSIPMPKKKHHRQRHSKQQHHRRHHHDHEQDDTSTTTKRKKSKSSSSSSLSTKDTTTKLHGFGKSRSSALTLGAPPSISSNIKASYITSILYGDDIICRTTKQSLDQLRLRIQKIEKRNIITKQVGWMTDALSLTVSSLKKHAHGSEGEEGRLSIPGKAYLVRPRRMRGGVSSIHEIGSGSREALRGAILWQLDDILLSRSMWKHHTFDAYISGLDRVQLRQISDDDDDNENDESYE